MRTMVTFCSKVSLQIGLQVIYSRTKAREMPCFYSCREGTMNDSPPRTYRTDILYDSRCCQETEPPEDTGDNIKSTYATNPGSFV